MVHRGEWRIVRRTVRVKVLLAAPLRAALLLQERHSKFPHRNSLQFRILRLRSDEHGDICIRVLPEREEILIRSACFRGVALHGVCSADLEMRQCAKWEV